MGDQLKERTDLVCPECGAYLKLKTSRFGLFYGCERWSSTGCKGSHGAHPNGAPMGVPANAQTKFARRQAHAVFDLLWQTRRMTRNQAYAWLAQALDHPDPHIGAMDIAECERVCALVKQHHGDLQCPPKESATNPNSPRTRKRRSRRTRSSKKRRTFSE